MKDKIWILLFVFGLMPFVVVLVGGIYASITGFSGIAISATYYGFDAFMEWVILWSFVYWPSYIAGIILIIISMIVKRRG